MEWTSPALILSLRLSGENGGIITALTRDHGLWRGFSKGVASRKQAPLWLAGNLVSATWKSRLADGLGFFTAELVQNNFAPILFHSMKSRLGACACALLEELLAERQRDADLFGRTLMLFAELRTQEARDLWRSYLDWELALLDSVGYGLSLRESAISGDRQGLYYVSPRTGAAVTRVEGAQWHDRLLRLPRFLTPDAQAQAANDEAPDSEAIAQGLALCGHFLAKAMGEQGGRVLPRARRALADLALKSGSENT